MNFRNNIIVITGGANGIGKSMVEEFIKAHAKVVVIDMDKKGIDCDFYFCGDVAEENTLVKFADEVISKYGKIDFLINNACISKRGILSGCSYDDFNYVLKVGLTAPYMLAKLFFPHFNIGGAIVNISSTRASMSQADTESYTAAKGGISALTHALSVSMAGKVRVNSISPGWIDTTNSEFSKEDSVQHPAGRVGKPIDIAKMAMFLCNEDSSFITGENITIDGGMSKLMVYHDNCGWKYEHN
jgi:NAD(P)-dependent dehydrogenase (short-subunit alcohol dehydrogenase family)